MEHVQTQVLPSPLLSTAPPPSFGCHFLPVPLKLVGALGPPSVPPVPTEHASGPGFHFASGLTEHVYRCRVHLQLQAQSGNFTLSKLNLRVRK